VPYGLQKDEGDEERILLILQFGGVSGNGFIEYARILETQKAMAASGEGRFEGGRFWKNGEREVGGEGRDGFQAVWEEVNGREMVYPGPRYEAPVLLKPAKIGWRNLGKDVWVKHLGSFTERATRVDILRVEKAKYEIRSQEALQLGFVIKGEGILSGELLSYEDAFRLKEGEGAVLESKIRVQRGECDGRLIMQ